MTGMRPPPTGDRRPARRRREPGGGGHFGRHLEGLEASASDMPGPPGRGDG